MSQRPGRIIEEIRVEIGDRDNPMKRRQTTLIGSYVVRLMNLLQIDRAAA
jgi:NitT/TauT family transport system ATP-binding protein